MENFSFPSPFFQQSIFPSIEVNEASTSLETRGINFPGYHIIRWLVLFSIPFGVTYVLTYIQAVIAINSRVKGKSVPTSPYWIPFIGHTLESLWAMSNVPVIARRGFPEGPLGIKFGPFKITFVTGAENIVKIWQSKVLQTREANYLGLRWLFGFPERSIGVFKKDTSGVRREPHPASNVPDKDRYYYHNRTILNRFFNGPGLGHMAKHFQDFLHVAISKLDVDQDWQEMPDLYTFVQHLITGPAIEAMCGPRLLEQNPNFVSQFWKFDSDIFWFIKLAPKFLIPSAFSNRSKLLASIKEWHVYAKANYKDSDVDDSGYEPCYGSPLTRRRHEILSQVESIDADAVAAQDLGLLWAGSGNSVPCIFWMLVELNRHPEAFKICMEEVNNTMAAGNTETDHTIDLAHLCKNPMLQSVYAEVLRLYISLFTLRSTVYEDFWLQNWRITPGQLVAVDTRAAHLNSRVWNSSAVSKHAEHISVNDFCPDRFLRYDDEATKKPVDAPAGDKTADAQARDATSAKPRFSVEGLAGAWIPYGGGDRQCPGKNFAKQEILLGFAMIMSAFEIEQLDEEKHGRVVPDLRSYGLGVFPPTREVPFRIRRRS